MAWKGIVGRSFTPAEFEAYVAGLRWTSWKPQFIVVHNTASPSLAQRPDGLTAQHIENLERYYRDDQHWSAGPHLFVDDRQIWVFTPLTMAGVHSPSWNGVALGVEMLGDFDHEAFTSGRGAAVRANAVAAIAILSKRLGFDPATIRLHKEDKKTTHDCPGRNVVKADLVAAVRARMAGGAVAVSAPAPEVDRTHSPAPDALRLRMAKRILDFEARRNIVGELVVYTLPAGDTGGSYEVAGFNDRYHPAEAAELRDLIKARHPAAAEARACDYILRDTAPAAEWTSDPGVEFMLRDTIHHRGRGGAAKILQRAVGVDQDGIVGPATKAAAAGMPAATLLRALRAAREAYEIDTYGKRAQFWRGFTNRWDQALAFGLSLQGGAAGGQSVAPPPAALATVPTPIALTERPGVLRTLWGMLRRQPAAPPSPEVVAAAARPGLAPGGDPQLYDLQKLLAAKGWAMVGRADGLPGPNTSAAILSFRHEAGLPVNDQIDDALFAAVAKSAIRRVAPSRAGATAKDLSADGSPGIGAARNLGLFGGITALGAAAEKLQSSGVIDQVTGTLDTIQGTASTITSVVTSTAGAIGWVAAHWQWIAIGLGLWMLLKAVRWVAETVALFRQGIINR